MVTASHPPLTTAPTAALPRPHVTVTHEKARFPSGDPFVATAYALLADDEI
ncbi:hypothetical protein [Streptomyces sp. NPDC049915]|uniref:hypothetical protein n=1 Tax=Streptomyces sp. NPDC049915 TaxID=3155510 RepID=UPI0034402E02